MACNKALTAQDLEPESDTTATPADTPHTLGRASQARGNLFHA